MKTEYKIGDLTNGNLEAFDTLEEAQAAYDDAVEEGGKLNSENIGEEGGYENKKDAQQAADDFYYIKKVTTTFDEDGDIEEEIEEQI